MRQSSNRSDHIRYRQIFNVKLSDLESLCRSCHILEHQRNGMPRRKRPRFSWVKLTEEEREFNRRVIDERAIQRQEYRATIKIQRKAPKIDKQTVAEILAFQRQREFTPRRVA